MKLAHARIDINVFRVCRNPPAILALVELLLSGVTVHNPLDLPFFGAAKSRAWALVAFSDA
jgi:hypothetical protein